MTPQRREIDPKDAVEVFEEADEPTELELLKIENEQLKDALHKTEQFKPGTVFLGEKSDEEIKEIKEAFSSGTMVLNAELDVYKILAEKADGVNAFYYDAYGIDLFKNRELSQLKNSGVKTFKRLYFEV